MIRTDAKVFASFYSGVESVDKKIWIAAAAIVKNREKPIPSCRGRPFKKSTVSINFYHHNYKVTI